MSDRASSFPPEIRLLLVEDNPDDIALIRDALAGCPYQRFSVRHAERLAAGLAEIEAVPPDVVLLDLGLPDSKGLDTLDRLLARSRPPPVVVLTGQEDDALGLEAVRRGAQDFLSKRVIAAPYLGRAVRYAVERHRMEMKIEESQRLYRELVENANSAIIRWQCDGTILFFNEYAQRCFGYPAAEAIGRHIGLIVPDRETTGRDPTGLVADIVRRPED